MEKDARIQDLEDSLRNNCPTLFLGAGFSREAVCGSGIMPTGNELCSEMIDIFIDPKVKSGEISSTDYDEIRKYKIRELCNAADGKRNERQLAVSGDADCVFGD